MRNPNGQKYCVGCEAWHFDKERPQKQKYTELVSLQGKQNIQLKPTEVQNVPKQINYNYALSQNVLQNLHLKLAYYSTMLNKENDIGKSKEILEAMKLCMENIVIANKLT
jgi:hypothetical protein